MMNKIDDDTIKNHLKNMPEIKDQRTKEEWIVKVQPYAYKRKRVPKKPSRMIPIFSTVLLIGIMVLIIPSIIKGPASINDQSISTQFEGEQRMLSEGENDTQVGSHSVESNDDQQQVGDFVLYALEEGEQLVYGGVFDQQVQYIIPLSFITSSDKSLSKAYNELDSYLAPFDSSNKIPYFKHMKFDIHMDEQIVTMHINDSYKIGEGSAIQVKFEEMISMIFQPYDIKEVRIQHENGSPVTLGEMGEISTINIQDPPRVNYKYYYDNAHEYGSLVPIEQGDNTFHQSIDDLKEEESDFAMQATIPANVDYTINCESTEDCMIHFSEEINQLSQSEQILALESILMTAKSYGYDRVSFEGISEDAIEGYDLTQSIEVPLAVNPVHVDNDS